MTEIRTDRSDVEAQLMLFDGHERTRQDPLRRGEDLFSYYDSCGLNGYDQLRSLINGWISQIPGEHRTDLISRMRYGGVGAFGAALCELIVATYLSKLNLKVIFHPDVPGSSNHPDFAVVDDTGKVRCYVEVTTVNRATGQEKEENREAVLYNAIDAVKLPVGCALGYNLVRAGPESPPTKPLKASIEKWASEHAEKARTTEIDARFQTGDWIVELELYAGGESQSTTHAIAVASMRGGLITPCKDIRAALVRKSRRYGTIDSPYLIVVADAKEQLFSAETVRNALTEAVFGDEIAVVSGGKIRLDYAKNGFWNGPAGPQNKHVSGVLLLPKTSIWELREPKWQPLFAVNPWATMPLPEELKTIARLEEEGGRWVRHTGTDLADILAVPEPWPPE